MYSNVEPYRIGVYDPSVSGQMGFDKDKFGFELTEIVVPIGHPICSVELFSIADFNLLLNQLPNSIIHWQSSDKNIKIDEDEENLTVRFFSNGIETHAIQISGSEFRQMIQVAKSNIDKRGDTEV